MDRSIRLLGWRHGSGARDALNASADAVAAPIEDPEPWPGLVGYLETACAMQAADHGLADVLTTPRPSCRSTWPTPESSTPTAAPPRRLAARRRPVHPGPRSSGPRPPVRVIPPRRPPRGHAPCRPRPASPHRSRSRPADPRPIPPCRGEARRRASPRCAGPATSGRRSRLIHRPQRLRLDRLPRRGRLASASALFWAQGPSRPRARTDLSVPEFHPGLPALPGVLAGFFGVRALRHESVRFTAVTRRAGLGCPGSGWGPGVRAGLP
jgi:hypothetical protein